MTQSVDAAIELAKRFITPMVLSSSQDWFGPIAYVLLRELDISYYGFPADNARTSIEPVYYSKNCSIPASKLRTLFNAASVHPEAYKLACSLAADFLDGDEKLPCEMKIFITAVLRDVWRTRKNKSYSKFKLPTPKTFLRDITIVKTIDVLKTEYGLFPTQNEVATSGITGSEVTKQALHSVMKELEKSGKDVSALSIPSSKSIEVIWSKFPTDAKLHKHVIAALRECKSHFTPINSMQ